MDNVNILDNIANEDHVELFTYDSRKSGNIISMSNIFIETGGPIRKLSRFSPWNALVIHGPYVLHKENFKNNTLKMRLNESACVEVRKGEQYKFGDFVDVKCPKGSNAVSQDSIGGCAKASNKCNCVSCKAPSSGSTSMITNKINFIPTLILLFVFFSLGTGSLN